MTLTTDESNQVAAWRQGPGSLKMPFQLEAAVERRQPPEERLVVVPIRIRSYL